MPWVREGKGMTAADIAASCEGSLRRLGTDVIDLYQIHWPERNVPAFGQLYYDPAKESSQTGIHEQLEALGRLVREGKVRHIGLSNETPGACTNSCAWPSSTACRAWPRCRTPTACSTAAGKTAWMKAATAWVSRCWPIRRRPSACSRASSTHAPTDPAAPQAARIARYESVRKQRWGRPEALAAARCNALAREHGMTPTQLALAFCYTKWQVASTIIGVTSVAQLDEDLNAWGTQLSPELLSAIDAIRWEVRDPAQ